MSNLEVINKIKNLSDDERGLLLFKLKEGYKSGAISLNNERAKRLVAYVQDDDTQNFDDLKNHLKQSLPDYMVPSSIIKVENIPTLPNGKIDKKGLQGLGVDSNLTIPNPIVDNNLTGPENETEERLIAIWEDVLGFSPIRVDDNFFEIGGDSILSIQIIAKARKIGIELKANQLFENQNIRDLANSILKVENVEKKWNFVTPIRKEGTGKPLFCIHSGGGHVFFYGLLKDYLKSNRPIYALQPSGINAGEDMHKDIEEMSKDYLEAIREIQPHGPYNILVYCFSISVGNEMSILLDKVNEKINIIVVDTMASAWNATGFETLRVRILSFIKRFFMNPVKTIRSFYIERAYMVNSVVIKLFGKSYEKELERLKANLRRISLIYKWKPHNGHVSLILTHKPDEKFQNHIIDSWKKVAKGGVNVHYTKGYHTTLFEKPDIEYVSEKIDLTIQD